MNISNIAKSILALTSVVNADSMEKYYMIKKKIAGIVLNVDVQIKIKSSQLEEHAVILERIIGTRVRAKRLPVEFCMWSKYI